VGKQASYGGKGRRSAVVSNRGGAANRYAAIRIEADTDFFCVILSMTDKERLSQKIEKDI
jgi:hypothetical protein